MAKKVVRSKYHIQFIGKVIVNYYPTKQTGYINRTMKGFKTTEKKAEFIADNPDSIPKDIKKAKRKTGNRKKRQILYYNQKIKNCYVCDKFMKFDDTTLEHIIPLSLGGSNRIDNLSLSHEKCNQEKGDNVI